jgi:molybdate transport system regulatory protein
MSHLNTSRRKKQIPLVPRLKVWLEAEGAYAFGFGLAEILQAVDQAGSIKQAASNLGKSYRYVWGRIKEAEEALGQQLVETHVGGKDIRRSFLAFAARQLVDDFLALRRRMVDIVEQECRRRFSWPIAGDSGNA